VAKRENNRSFRQRGYQECKPLIDAATKDLFRKNAFRITGLSVDATSREISRHAARIKMLAELEQGAQANGVAFPIKPPPSLDEIREAIQKLKDPEKRLIDEFFWFWPEEFGDGQSDPAMQALAKGDSKAAIDAWLAIEDDDVCGITAKHNLAVAGHLYALDWENYSIKNEVEAEGRDRIANFWKGAFNRWECLANDERLWEKVTARIRQLNEPDLETDFARKMRVALPEALDRINAELAVAFAESGKIELARLHIQFMRETNQGLDDVERTSELVLAPAKNRLRETIQQAKERARRDPQDAGSAAKELLQQAQQTTFLFDLFLGNESDIRNDLCDEVAAVCNHLQIAYYKATSDDKTCLDILKAILPLAVSTDLRRIIEKDLAETHARLEREGLEPVYALLAAIRDSEDSPRARLERFNAEASVALNSAMAELSLGSDGYNELWEFAALVLRGISLDAWNDHQDWETAVAANRDALRAATSLVLKRRLSEDEGTLRQAHLLADLTPVTSAPSLGTVNGIGLTCYGSTDSDPIAGSYLTTQYFVFLGIPLFPINRYRVTSDGVSYRFLGKAGLRPIDLLHRVAVIGAILWLLVLNGGSTTSSNASSYAPRSSSTSTPVYTPPRTPSGGTPSGNVYRAPNSERSALDKEEAEIELERRRLDALEAQIETLGREVENARRYADLTSQVAVNEFNRKVERHNALLEEVKAAFAAFNRRVNSYNAKVSQGR